MARETGITKVLRDAIGYPPARGAIARFSERLPDSIDRSSPSRWLKGARPDPAVWSAIEDALELKSGTLAAADAGWTVVHLDTNVLLTRLADLEERVSQLDDLQATVDRLKRQVERIAELTLGPDADDEQPPDETRAAQ